MYKIGIIGSDSSHALAFARLCNADKCVDMRVTMLYDPEPSRAAHTAKVAEDGAIERVAEKPEDMIGRVDVVMIVLRHGSLHARYALPFLEKCVPVWMDKPFTADVREAEDLVQAAAKYNTLLTGGSTMRFDDSIIELADIIKNDPSIGSVKSVFLNFPGDFNSEYDGIFFYGSHSVEMMMRLFGKRVESVISTVINHDLVTVLKYPSFHAAINFVNTWHQHHLILYSENKTLARTLGITDTYKKGLEDLYTMLETKTQPHPLDDLVYPIKVLHAIDRSIKERKEIFIGE
jgi:predicted dehydrogenase